MITSKKIHVADIMSSAPAHRVPVACLGHNCGDPLLGGGSAVLAEPAPLARLREPHSYNVQPHSYSPT